VQLAEILCHIWAEDNHILTDLQNGFRKGRSTIDHLSTLTSIIETRKKSRKSTFCAFIDLKKAYDCVDRTLLWKTLETMGVNGRMKTAVKSLYDHVQCCVRVNGFDTDWFDVKGGLKQGCALSPTLFNLFINDLSTCLLALGKGVCLGHERVALLMYADDLVLIAESPEDLQEMLDCLNNWCGVNRICINPSKSGVIHFRPASFKRTDYDFVCGDNDIVLRSEYSYLGIVLNEHLDYSYTAKCVAQSANRALGLIIAKVKSFGGVPYNVYTKLYDSIVFPVIAYGAAIWGTDSYSCIDAVQHRAARFFLNVGKYTPNAAVEGDMGWMPMLARQWKVVSGFWSRVSTMQSVRLNKRVALWACAEAGVKCKNWFYKVKTKFNECDAGMLDDLDSPVSKFAMYQSVVPSVFERCVHGWQEDVNRDVSKTGKGLNKLRTYRLFKSEFITESYCKTILSCKQRGALAKFRSGTAPIRLETGRYELLPVSERTCFNCCGLVEDELHVLIHCPMYEDLRYHLFF
jgi:hypothetical protein